MNAPAGLDLASIPDRIQSEVQRAIQRSIKGVEYFSTSGPSLGSTPKDILATRGTMNLYHYRPVADEIYRIPILIVMATTNRGYILDMVPGQSFIEFLLKRGYDVYMLDWTAPRPEEKSLRMEDYVLDFIPDCVRRLCFLIVLRVLMPESCIQAFYTWTTVVPELLPRRSPAE